MTKNVMTFGGKCKIRKGENVNKKLVLNYHRQITKIRSKNMCTILYVVLENEEYIEIL